MELQETAGILDRISVPAVVERSACTAERPFPAQVRVSAELLASVLDLMDCGVMLLIREQRLLFANAAAHQLMQRNEPLVLTGGRVQAQARADALLLLSAVNGAIDHSTRRMLLLGQGTSAIRIAVAPVGQVDGQPAAVGVFGRAALATDLAIEWFAQSMGFTTAESSVLRSLCNGAEPLAIAIEHDVALSTVRTQIGNLRAKSGAKSIRELLLRVACLPPMQSCLRSGRFEARDEGYRR